MPVRIEFFGIARERAGVSDIHIEAGSLGDALAQAGMRLPAFAETCLSGGALAAGYVANVNGDRFVTDPDVALRPGDSVLILHADSGG
jgi:molybdopterin converting factor small subunit